MSIFKKNEPSSDRLDNEQYMKLKGLFAKAVGQPKDAKSTQNVLFKELNNFHEYYGAKIAELNKQIERLKGIVKSVQIEYNNMERSLSERQTQFQIVSRENEELTKIIQSLKQNQKQQKTSDKTDIHHFYESINESYKDKVNNIQAQHIGQLDILRTKLSLMNKQKVDLAKQVEKLTAENSTLKLEIKQYQVQKRYEGDRIKNATLQLQIKIKNQDELISRLSKDLSKDLSVRTNTCRLSDIDKRDIMNDSTGGGVLISDSNFDGVLNGSLIDQFKITNKKIPNLSQFNSKQLLPFQKQNNKKLKYIHSRNLSNHDQQKTPREQQMKTTRDTRQKGQSELKMKVMRLQKMRRK